MLRRRRRIHSFGIVVGLTCLALACVEGIRGRQPLATRTSTTIPSTKTKVKSSSKKSSLPTIVSGYGSHKKYDNELTMAAANSTMAPNLIRLRVSSDGMDVTARNQTVHISSDGIIQWRNDDANIETPPPNKSLGTSQPKIQRHVVQGLFGVYSLPSAHLWVWIAESEPVYEAPRIQGTRHWWTICKVKRLEIIRIPLANSQRQPAAATRSQRQEEHRQVALLRQALKHHDWYYSSTAPPASSDQQQQQPRPVVSDMIHNLQVSIARHVKDTNANANATTTNHTRMMEDDTGRDNATTTKHIKDSRFFWNEALVEMLSHGAMSNISNAQTDGAASRFLHNLVIPVTSAFVGIQTDLEINMASDQRQQQQQDDNNSFCYDLLLITRRNRFRVGTRFTRRGADGTGNCANYAETEQVILVKHKTNSSLAAICSHLQTRGSIPLRWSSPTDIKTYRPRVRIGIDPMGQARSLRNHLLDQVSHYVVMSNINETATCEQPMLLFVNLIDKKSDQGRLGRAFSSVLKAVLDVYETSAELADASVDPRLCRLINSACIQHVWFDFHAELKRGRWDKLGSLLNQVKVPLMAQGYFRAMPQLSNDTISFTVDRIQTGITRTNCMDCLDRTNVVQSVFGRLMAFEQLSDYKPIGMPLALKTVFRRNALTLPWASGETALRLLWADNADAVSSLYAGTPALKGDFTRTGRRTKRGALDDGMNSLQRFYLNNFFDAFRQEGMDLLTGDQPFVVSSDAREPVSLRSNLVVNGMSIQAAARQALLGPWKDFADNDREHVRIKVNEENLGLFAAGGHVAKPRLHELRWLPGDLQSQVRGAAVEDPIDGTDDDQLSIGEALETMDIRASTHLPWWYSPETTSESDGSGKQATRGAENEGVDNAGYLIMGLVVGAQAPIGLASAALALLAGGVIET